MRRKSWTRLTLLGVVLGIFSSAARGDDAEPVFPAEQLEFFESAVRPLLIEHCYECNSVA